MPQPRVPTNILRLRGADKKHPDRMKERENEPVNKNPIGKPPSYLTVKEKKYWGEIIHDCIDGVLGEADRIAVSMAARLLGKCAGNNATSQEQTQLFRYLGQFGMTPSERSKIAIPKAKPKNKFDDD